MPNTRPMLPSRSAAVVPDFSAFTSAGIWVNFASASGDHTPTRPVVGALLMLSILRASAKAARLSGVVPAVPTAYGISAYSARPSELIFSASATAAGSMKMRLRSEMFTAVSIAEAFASTVASLSSLTSTESSFMS